MCTELVCLVHQDKVILVSIPIIVILFIENLAQTTIADETSVLINTEVFESLLPVMLYGRWVNHQNLCVLIAIVNTELLCNHCSNDSLTKTHNVSEEETIVFEQLLVTLHNGICLIFILVIALWHIKGILCICSKHTVREVLHQHLDIQLVWGNVTIKICLLNRSSFDVLGSNQTTFSFCPEQFKFILGKLYILVVTEHYIELILLVLTNAESIATEVAGASNSASVCTPFIEVVWIEQVNLSMDLLAWVSTKFEFSAYKVIDHLPDTFFNMA